MKAQRMNAAKQALENGTVTRVYSGRPGCGCGCRGKYYDDARNITRVTNLMLARIDADELGDDITISDAVVATENDTRYFWAYIRDQKAERDNLDAGLARLRARARARARYDGRR